MLASTSIRTQPCICSEPDARWKMFLDRDLPWENHPRTRMQEASLISIVLSILALTFSGFAIYSNRQLASSGYRASEQVKLDIARMISVLRSLMVKGALYSQQDPSRRNEPSFTDYIEITSELKAVQDLMLSPTALAFHALAARKSKAARERGDESEVWRVFALQLAVLQRASTPSEAATLAAEIEQMLEGLSDEEFSNLSDSLSDLPRTARNLFAERQHDVIAAASVDMQRERARRAPNFFEFVDLLRTEKGVKDPDLDMFWASHTGDVKLLEAALAAGAKVHTTQSDLVRRYLDEYSSFVSGRD